MKFRPSIYSYEFTQMTGWLVCKRKEAQLSQRDLTHKIGVVHSLVGKVEKGERRLDVIELVRYCNALQADPHELIEEMQKTLAQDVQSIAVWQ